MAVSTWSLNDASSLRDQSVTKSHNYASIVMNNIIFISCDVPLKDEMLILKHFTECVKIMIMIISVFFNLTIISVICFNKYLRTIPRAFIASMAVSDLINSFVTGTTAIFEISECGREQRLNFVYIVAFLSLYGLTSNLFNHLVISTERWMYIARPFLHPRIVTPRTAAISIIFVWVVAGAVNASLLIGHSLHDLSLARFHSGIISPAFHFFLSLLMFSIYSDIALIARRQIQLINKTRPMGVSIVDPTVNTSRTPVLAIWRNVRLLVTVFGIFFILMTPSICVNIYVYVNDMNFFGSVFGRISELLWYSHCLANFIIFTARDNVFRGVLKRGFMKVSRWICRKQVGTENYWT